MNEPELQMCRAIACRADALREELCALSAINSGSFNVAGVEATAARVAQGFAPLAARVEWLDLPPHRETADDGHERLRPLGRAVRLRQRPDAPIQVFLCGHLDTVFGPEHPFQQPRWLDADRLCGPGVADLKGGLLVMRLALEALEASPQRERLGWTVLLNPDEEIGSPGSAPLLREAAAHHHLGLVYEPALPDGSLAGARKGSGNFELVIHGRAAHAGRNPQDGRNALALAARLATRLDALNGERDGLSINVGYLHGGGPLNIVPPLAVLKFNVRTGRPDDECWLHERLDALLVGAIPAGIDGYRIELRGGFTRPTKPVDAAAAHLQALVAECGDALGLELAFRPTGGCCDGNNLAAAGLPNVDNLGVVGGEIHSDREWMRWSSLAERASLSALLLMRLANGDYPPVRSSIEAMK